MHKVPVSAEGHSQNVDLKDFERLAPHTIHTMTKTLKDLLHTQ